jgi:ATP-dependent DNA ligase
MTKTLQLAKGFDLTKLSDQVYVSEKLDGVPIRMDININDMGPSINAVTRQNEQSISTLFLQSKMLQQISASGLDYGDYTFVGEVTHEDYKDFKDVSGVVRRQSPQSGLVYNIFDFADHSRVGDTFAQRILAAQLLITPNAYRRIIPQTAIDKHDVIEWMEKNISVTAEGGVVRDAFDKWAPGKRTWGYQKYVLDPTIDLNIVRVEEATSETGVPLGMAGRLVAEYKGREIGIGPGKLSHNERKEVFAEYKQWQSAIASGYKETKWKIIACIKYKRDPSYSDLRQPTFQHWRFDKDEADA